MLCLRFSFSSALTLCDWRLVPLVSRTKCVCACVRACVCAGGRVGGSAGAGQGPKRPRPMSLYPPPLSSPGGTRPDPTTATSQGRPGGGLGVGPRSDEAVQSRLFRSCLRRLHRLHSLDDPVRQWLLAAVDLICTCSIGHYADVQAVAQGLVSLPLLLKLVGEFQSLQRLPEQATLLRCLSEVWWVYGSDGEGESKWATDSKHWLPLSWEMVSKAQQQVCLMDGSPSCGPSQDLWGRISGRAVDPRWYLPSRTRKRGGGLCGCCVLSRSSSLILVSIRALISETLWPPADRGRGPQTWGVRSSQERGGRGLAKRLGAVAVVLATTG